MQRPHRALTLASGLASAALLFHTPPARAEPVPASVSVSDVPLSERYAARAFEAYRQRDYASAVTLYQKALDAAPSADILYNMARVYDVGLRDRTLAISFYNRYVGDPGAVPKQIETANKRLAELRAAELAATAPALATPETTMAQPTPSASPAPVAASVDSSSGVSPAAVVAGSVGLVGIGLGVGFGFAAKSDLDESERYCNGNQCTSQRGVDAAKSAAREANIATVGFVAGGALLALGSVLWLMGDAREEQPELAGGLGWSPHIGRDELSLSVSGSYVGP
jgi:tetratricopeptide (TPR) repeat protein